MRVHHLFIVALLAAACGGEDNNFGKHGFNSESLALSNAEGEDSVLRAGTALNIGTKQELELEPNTVYTVVVKNLDTGSEVSRADLLSDMLGQVQLSTVAHDIGEFDDVEEMHTLSITVETKAGGKMAQVDVPMTPHIPDFVGHGFVVDEIQPPHVYSCTPDGTALNSYITGALPDPGEVSAPIYAAGKGYPAGITQVDIYLLKDADKWQGKAIPKPGDADYIAGPVVGTIDRGALRPTAIEWTPTGKDLGPYDIVVDVDRNGKFDYSFGAKDASDGEDKVGLTIQYGAAWFRAKTAAVAAKLSVDAAKNAYDAADAAAAKALAEAKGPDAEALANQARDKANLAKSELDIATTSSTDADKAFNQTLADDKTAQAKANAADTAAKNATKYSKEAADLVNDTIQATKAYEAEMKAMAAKMLSKHLLVNLAYSSKSRTGGKWLNEYTTKSKLYSYVNPPVQKGDKHAFVTKLVVEHQSWKNFWNNPELIMAGGKGAGKIKISHLVVQMTGGKVQNSCTNAPPVAIINPPTLPITETVNLLKYDVVYDYDNDGHYDIGRDMLDVVAHTQTGQVVSAKDLASLPDDQIYGFLVKKAP